MTRFCSSQRSLLVGCAGWAEADPSAIPQKKRFLGESGKPEILKRAGGILILAGTADDRGYVITPERGYNVRIARGNRLQDGHSKQDRFARRVHPVMLDTKASVAVLAQDGRGYRALQISVDRTQVGHASDCADIRH